MFYESAIYPSPKCVIATLPPTSYILKMSHGFFWTTQSISLDGPIILLAFLSESSKIIRRLCGYHHSGRYYLGDAFRGLFKRSRRRGRI